MYFLATASDYAGKLYLRLWEHQSVAQSDRPARLLERWDAVDCLRSDDDGSNALVTLSEMTFQAAGVWVPNSWNQETLKLELPV